MSMLDAPLKPGMFLSKCVRAGYRSDILYLTGGNGTYTTGYYDLKFIYHLYPTTFAIAIPFNSEVNIYEFKKANTNKQCLL